MTDTYIEQILTNAFLTLNEFSGIEYIKKNGKGDMLNVSLPNIPFTEPLDKRFFAVSFLANEPDPAGLGNNAENRWDGIFQIDIMVPLGAGMDESAIKYDWINKLFQRGKSFGDVMIKRTYRAAHGAELAYYRTVVRVEFTCTLPKD
jgi:hypothetical protein